jgi:hypothetical protein
MNGRKNVIIKFVLDVCILQVFQAVALRDATWGCDWIGTPVPFQRCLVFIIATANKEFTLSAGKFVPVCNKTMMNVRVVIYYVQHNSQSLWTYN